jgi:hypothetical protein
MGTRLLVQRPWRPAAKGGHHIPDKVVRRRFVAGKANFDGLYRDLVDAWVLDDNSEAFPASLHRSAVNAPMSSKPARARRSSGKPAIDQRARAARSSPRIPSRLESSASHSARLRPAVGERSHGRWFSEVLAHAADRAHGAQVHDAVPETFLARRYRLKGRFGSRRCSRWTEHRNSDPAAQVRGTAMFG